MNGTLHDLGTFDAPGLTPGRRVRVYEPAGKWPHMPRPVLYLFDGQNVFDDTGSFSGGWYAQDAVDTLIPRRRIVAPLVVGIEHGGEARIDELGPFKMGKQGGLTDVLLDWMTGTLIPLINTRFTTIRGPLGTVVGGSSMGGLAALYAHFSRPESFGGALCMSPAFWFARRAIVKDVKARPTPPLSRIYIDCGAREGGGAMLAICGQIDEGLKGRGYPPEQLLFKVDPRGTHSERAWRRRLPQALRFMFRFGTP